MAMPIKFVPILTGQTAANFVAEADSNKNQTTSTLSGKTAERLKKVLENQRLLLSDIATRLMFFDLKKS